MTSLPRRLLDKYLHDRGYMIVPRKHKISPDVSFNEMYRALFPAESLAERRFYNIGSGGFRHPFWSNIDLPSEHYATHKANIDLPYDIEARQPLPLPDKSAALFYSSAVAEHVTVAGWANLAAECRRVLKPGGIFRVTVPDAEVIARAYLDKDVHFFRHYAGDPSVRDGLLNYLACGLVPDPAWSEERLDDLFASNSLEAAFDILSAAQAGAEAMANRHPGWHISIWTTGRMRQTLLRAGFRKVEVSAHGRSACPVFWDTRYFDCTNPGIHFFIDAHA